MEPVLDITSAKAVEMTDSIEGIESRQTSTLVRLGAEYKVRARMNVARAVVLYPFRSIPLKYG